MENSCTAGNAGNLRRARNLLGDFDDLLDFEERTTPDRIIRSCLLILREAVGELVQRVEYLDGMVSKVSDQLGDRPRGQST